MIGADVLVGCMMMIRVGLIMGKVGWMMIGGGGVLLGWTMMGTVGHRIGVLTGIVG